MSIKTWQEHLESTVSEMQIVSSLMIQQAMQDEIDSLRDALKKASNLDVHRCDHIETLHTERDQLSAALEATMLKEAELTVEVYTLRMELGDLPQAQADMLATIKAQRKVLDQSLNALCAVVGVVGFAYTPQNKRKKVDEAITAIQEQLK